MEVNYLRGPHGIRFALFQSKPEFHSRKKSKVIELMCENRQPLLKEEASWPGAVPAPNENYAAALRLARRGAVTVFGTTVLALGVAMLVLPGPGILGIACGLAILATLRDQLGSLDRVKRLVKTLGMVNSTPDFPDHPKVINGYSELMAEVFGPEHGIGARSAVGMGSLPGNIAVEIEAIFEIA